MQRLPCPSFASATSALHFNTQAQGPAPVIMLTPTCVARPSCQPVVRIQKRFVSSYVAHCEAVSSVPRICSRRHAPCQAAAAAKLAE